VKNMVCIAHIIGASKLGTVATGNFKYWIIDSNSTKDNQILILVTNKL
jgi:hypothetical protein